MPNKPVRQSAKFKEQQYRKRMATQARTGALPAELNDADSDAVRVGGGPLAEGSTVRFAPASNGTGTATATAVATARPGVATRRPTPMAMPSAVRTARGRIATQMLQMNLEDEMAFIRADIRRLLILAAASFAVLIVLAFLIR